MKKKIKRFVLLALLGGIVYALLNYHFVIYVGEETKTVKPLKKSTLTLSETFVSLETGEFSNVKSILERGTLRDDGLGDLMVELGILTPDQLRQIEDEIDSGQ